MPLSRLRVVVGSAFGELATLVEMLEERERDGLLSPLRFQNSVHNSAAGQLSIAHKNKAPGDVAGGRQRHGRDGAARGD